MKIALVPNDDGYGPSALGFYVAKALLLRQEVSLVVRNESAMNLNAVFYKDEINNGRVSLQPTFGGIRLRKTAEGVDTPATLRDIQDYSKRSDKYVIPEDVDAVIDIGTPAAAKAARKARKPVFTIFDHSWGKTYEMTLEDFFEATLGLNRTSKTGLIDLIRTNISKSTLIKAIERIKKDEKNTQAVFLFDSYITPKLFHKHWKSLGVSIEHIHGVFGGSSVTRQEARKRMKIADDTPKDTVYILGGGTPVWDAKLPEIISQLKEKDLKYNVVVFDRSAKPNDYIKVGNNVYKGGAIDGETVQGLLPGIDLIITRAGGGIVNDAIACRVPFVCVEEPNHKQVEMIRQNCERKRLTRTIKIKEFREGNIGQIMEKELGNTDGNRIILEEMNKIKNGTEKAVIERIIELCSQKR